MQVFVKRRIYKLQNINAFLILKESLKIPQIKKIAQGYKPLKN
jgi:hypothetical protein